MTADPTPAENARRLDRLESTILKLAETTANLERIVAADVERARSIDQRLTRVEKTGWAMISAVLAADLAAALGLIIGT